MPSGWHGLKLKTMLQGFRNLPDFAFLGVSPFVALTAFVTWLAAGWRHQSKARREAIERGDQLEMHRDGLTLDLIQNARDEMDLPARKPCICARKSGTFDQWKITFSVFNRRSITSKLCFSLKMMKLAKLPNATPALFSRECAK